MELKIEKSVAFCSSITILLKKTGSKDANDVYYTWEMPSDTQIHKFTNTQIQNAKIVKSFV